ncbi:MAG: sigma-70 family RNA polymerase sigma factor [Planctomycetes bacterium]|nr:sigma-70 family RNA polymerase sigma factor [Planctomycetota bacterium]
MKKTIDIEPVWRKYRRSHSVSARNQLVEHYLPIVQKLAEIMARKLWPRVTADELASAGYDGLIASVGTFDVTRGVKFETYCRQRIVGAIRDWQREIDPLGRSGRNFERSLVAAEEKLQAELGRRPSPEELAERMGVALGKFEKMRKTLLASRSVPLEMTVTRRNENCIGRLIPPDPSPGPTTRTERHMIREFLTKGLKEQDRLIITLYYYERLTMAEIGAVLNVSESRVCQRHGEIIQQLRHRFAKVPCDLVA